MASKSAQILKDNVWGNNPVFVQILGICSTLAVTNDAMNTLILATSVTFVTAFSNFFLSLMKNWIPRKVRMIIQTLVISFFVILVDIALRAFLPNISKALGPYVGLIITNCIIMGRAEAFAQSNKPFLSFWDGLTTGFGFMIVLMTIAICREILGFGSIFGIRLLSESFVPWTIMIMAPSGFFMLGIFIWIARGNYLAKTATKKNQEAKP